MLRRHLRDLWVHQLAGLVVLGWAWLLLVGGLLQRLTVTLLVRRTLRVGEWHHVLRWGRRILAVRRARELHLRVGVLWHRLRRRLLVRLRGRNVQLLLQLVQLLLLLLLLVLHLVQHLLALKVLLLLLLLTRRWRQQLARLRLRRLQELRLRRLALRQRLQLL